MSKKSPLEIVQQDHGSKAELAKEIFELLEHPEDEDEAHELEYRVQTMSNRKLLRLWNAHQVLDDKFGAKDELVEAVMSAKFPDGNEEYRKKIQTFPITRLLDLARQNGLVKQSELGWRQ